MFVVDCRERADLTDSIGELDEEIVTLTRDLKKAHHKSTALTALKRTAEVRHSDYIIHVLCCPCNSLYGISVTVMSAAGDI